MYRRFLSAGGLFPEEASDIIVPIRGARGDIVAPIFQECA
jgi:hypothetical protein